MSYIAQFNINGGGNIPVGSSLYGTCVTDTNTQAKIVKCANFDTLITGITIHVKFTYANTTGSTTTLNVNSTGAKSVSGASWGAGAVLSFTYDGSSWIMNDVTPSESQSVDLDSYLSEHIASNSEVNALFT